MNTVSFLAQHFDVDPFGPSPITVRRTSRRHMARALAYLGMNTGVEVGVAEGIHAEILCQANPNLYLVGVDIYQMYDGYAEYPNIDKAFWQASDRLASYNYRLVCEMSTDAAPMFDDGTLDFVYIDAAHDYASVTADLAAWTPKVRAGGVVFGHDFKHHTAGRRHKHTVEVKPAVEAFCKGREPWFVLANDLEPDNPGWLFVK